MRFRQAVPAMLMLAACSHEPPPCPATQPRETAVLIVSVISPGEPIANYQQEFATMDACEAARRQVHDEMERLVDRAKAVDFNNDSSTMDSTDWRGRFRRYTYAVHRDRDYPDLTASCSSRAVAGATAGQPEPPTDISSMVRDMAPPGSAPVITTAPAPPAGR